MWSINVLHSNNIIWIVAGCLVYVRFRVSRHNVLFSQQFIVIFGMRKSKAWSRLGIILCNFIFMAPTVNAKLFSGICLRYYKMEERCLTKRGGMWFGGTSVYIFFLQILTSICGWVIPGLSSKEGQIDVCFPAINDGVGFFRRCLGFSLIRHGYLCNERQRNKTRWRCCIDFHIHSSFDSRYENNEHRETNEQYKMKIFLCYSSWDISFIWFEVCNVQRENKAKWKCGTALYHRNSIHHLIWGGRIMRYKTPNSLWSAINAPFLISPSLLAIIQASSSFLSSRVFGVLLA